MWDMHESSGWWILFGWLWFAVFWVSILYFAMWMVRKITGQNSLEESKPALEIARTRYAQGEISRDEFQRIKRDLY